MTKTRRIGRNQPCPCGSGKKFKKCCRLIDPWMEYDFEILESGPLTPALASLTSREGPLRPVEVLETDPGRGLFARLMDREVDEWPDRIWIADENASYALAKGDVFTTTAKRPEDVEIYPFWEGCQHCLDLIAKRKRQHGVS